MAERISTHEPATPGWHRDMCRYWIDDARWCRETWGHLGRMRVADADRAGFRRMGIESLRRATEHLVASMRGRCHAS